ncbi:ATP-binding protein [Candidatus Woesearchaeota archaeon]|nr:ATP-binding protein [Candidatus Woesearchaeota archaeon]
MKFYNREQELAEIEHFYKNKPAMLVITGRRRIGKTELVKKIKKQVYFFVDSEKSETMLIQEFFSELKQNFEVDKLIKVSSWEELFDLIFKIAQKKEIVVSFDEFQRFLKIDPSIIFQLQKYWDMHKNKSKIFLVFTGSSVGMIKKIFIENNAPLFKRAQNIIYLKPFKFKIIREIMADFGIKKFEEQIRIYALFGGIINYYSLMDFYNVKNLEEIFEKLILRRYAPLKNEVREVFIEEFGKEHKTYYSILAALAAGKNTKKEIEDVVDVKGTSLSPYFYDLIDILNIVDIELPFNEDKGSKKGRYSLKDNFFKFWFRFIFNNMSYYEKEDFAHIDKLINNNFNAFVGHGFEEICMELIEEDIVRLPFEWTKIGRWWSRRGEEIDIVAANNNTKEIMFIECKWQEDVNAEKVLSELKEKAKLVEWHNADRKEHYAIFAKSFKESKNIIDKNFLLFELNDIEKLLK